MVVEYDGTAFSGWQSQGASPIRTVQGTLEQVLSLVLQERIVLGVAGRTDAGVHAGGQVASFVTTNPLPLHRLARALSGLLPPDVAARSLAVVAPGFHARFSAVERRYVYRLLDQPRPLEARRAWWPWMRFDAAALTEAYRPLLGEHDFASFAARSPTKRPPSHGAAGCRGLRSCRGARRALEAHANRFLYHMVRNLVGRRPGDPRPDRPCGPAADPRGGQAQRRRPDRARTASRWWMWSTRRPGPDRGARRRLEEPLVKRATLVILLLAAAAAARAATPRAASSPSTTRA
jgi:tRNA pseudouridine38-40 synthase